MKTRMYAYTCEHPGSDVIITSDKPMNRLICPLCAAVMLPFYAGLLGVPYNKDRGDDPALEKQNDLSTRMVRNLKEAYAVAESLDAHSGYKSINNFPVQDPDAEAAEAGKELFDQVSGGSKMRVPEKVIMTGNPGMPAYQEITKQTFSMENKMTKYHGKLISEVDFYFEAEEALDYSCVPEDYPEQVRELIAKEAERLGKNNFYVGTLHKHQTGTFKNSSED